MNLKASHPKLPTIGGHGKINGMNFLPNAKLVAQLSETDVRQLNPVTYDIKKTALENAYDAMVSELVPDTLKFNPKCKIIDFDSNSCFFYIKRLIKLPW